MTDTYRCRRPQLYTQNGCFAWGFVCLFEAGCIVSCIPQNIEVIVLCSEQGSVRDTQKVKKKKKLKKQKTDEMMTALKFLKSAPFLRNKIDSYSMKKDEKTQTCLKL